MATGTTGAPWSIPYPVGADTYALTSDIAALAVRVAVSLSSIDADVTTVEAGLASAVAAADAAVAAVGTATVALDTDGTPYYTTSGATHYILTDGEGPYITATFTPTVTLESGVPIIS